MSASVLHLHKDIAGFYRHSHVVLYSVKDSFKEHLFGNRKEELCIHTSQLSLLLRCSDGAVSIFGLAVRINGRKIGLKHGAFLSRGLMHPPNLYIKGIVYIIVYLFTM